MEDTTARRSVVSNYAQTVRHRVLHHLQDPRQRAYFTNSDRRDWDGWISAAAIAFRLPPTLATSELTEGLTVYEGVESIMDTMVSDGVLECRENDGIRQYRIPGDPGYKRVTGSPARGRRARQHASPAYALAEDRVSYREASTDDNP